MTRCPSLYAVRWNSLSLPRLRLSQHADDMGSATREGPFVPLSVSSNVPRSRMHLTSGGVACLTYSSMTNLISFTDTDSARATGASVTIGLNRPAMPIASLSSYDASTTPIELNTASGLAKHEIAVGRYLDISISDML